MGFNYNKRLLELKSGPCKDCGQSFDPVCMDFDHRPDEVKSGPIARFRSDEDGFMAEVAKCDLVCAICHRLRTKNRGVSDLTKSKLRGKKASEDKKKAISQKVSKAWADPDTRNKMREAQIQSWARRKAGT